MLLKVIQGSLQAKTAVVPPPAAFAGVTILLPARPALEPNGRIVIPAIETGRDL